MVYNVRFRMSIPPNAIPEGLFENKYLKKSIEKGIYEWSGVPVNYMNILAFMEKNTGGGR